MKYQAARAEPGFDAPILVRGNLVGYAHIAYGKVVGWVDAKTPVSRSAEKAAPQVQPEARRPSQRRSSATTNDQLRLFVWQSALEPPDSRRRR